MPPAPVLRKVRSALSPCSRSLSLRSGLIEVLALVSLVLAAPTAEPGAAPDPFSVFQVQPFQEPIPAPPLSLEGTDGRRLRLADLKGKVVFLNFWATWCVPCRQEMPAMQRLFREYRERGLAVVAINFMESKDAVDRFFKELHLDFPTALDPDGATARTFTVRGLPVTFLLGRDGRILWKAIGSRDWDSATGRAYFEYVLQATRP